MNLLFSVFVSYMTVIVGPQKQQQQRAIFALILGELLRLNCARSYRPTLYGKIIKLLRAASCVSSCTTVENTADHNNKQKGLKVAKEVLMAERLNGC